MKGSYTLLIRVNKRIDQAVGKLGLLNFEKGDYVYVGSAMNNLEKRVARHKKTAGLKLCRKHWHIDYLLLNKNVKFVKAKLFPSDKREECRIAERFSGKAKPIKDFGASDCNCVSHLFYLGDKDA